MQSSKVTLRAPLQQEVLIFAYFSIGICTVNLSKPVSRARSRDLGPRIDVGLATNLRISCRATTCRHSCFLRQQM